MSNMTDGIVDFRSTERGFSLPYKPDIEFCETEESARRAKEELLKYKVLAVDVETTGLDPYLNRILLFQIATPDKCYILNCVKIDPSIWGEILSDKSILKIAHNAKFDYKMLKRYTGVSMRPIFDTMLAERLLTAGTKQGVSFGYLSTKYFGIEVDKDIRKNFIGVYRDKFSRSELLYAANDVLMLHMFYDIQIDALQRDGLITTALLEFNTIVPVAEMELNGCMLNTDKWRALIDVAEKNRIESASKIQEIVKPVCNQLTVFGDPTLNIASQPQLLRHLHRLGINIEDTKDETLKRHKGIEIIDHIRDWRKWEKLCTSYGEALLEKINPKTGRLHAEFNQLRAETGRMAAKRPNLQQVPGFIEDDPSSLNFRSCFIAPEGYDVVTADYSQQELRCIACISEDKNFINAYVNDEDIHTQTAINIWGGTPEEVRGNGKRKIAKTINFLMCFGGSSYTLSKRLDIPEEEAEGIIQGYFKAYPGLKKYIKSAGDFAVQNGYSTTVSGRRRYYNVPSRDDEKYDTKMGAIRRKGANAPIQGAAADVTKQGLCNFFYALEDGGYDARLLMVVHDEIVCEVRKDQSKEVAKLLEDSMIKGFYDFFKQVPMNVDACIDTYWHH